MPCVPARRALREEFHKARRLLRFLIRFFGVRICTQAEVSFGDGHQGQAGHEATPSGAVLFGLAGPCGLVPFLISDLCAEIVETSTPRGGFPASEAADGNEDKIEDWEEGEEDFEAGDGGEEGATAGQEGEDAATGDWVRQLSACIGGIKACMDSPWLGYFRHGLMPWLWDNSDRT